MVFMPIHGGFFNFWEFRQLLAADGSLLRFMAQLLRFEVPAMQWKSGGLTKQRLEGLAQLLRPGANSESLWQLFCSLWQLMATYGNLWRFIANVCNGYLWQSYIGLESQYCMETGRANKSVSARTAIAAWKPKPKAKQFLSKQLEAWGNF